MIGSDKARFSTSGSYTGTVEVGTDDNLKLYLKDNSGKKTLEEILNHTPAHSIGDHSNMGSDFAAQYYNKARLESFVADPANGDSVGVSGDVGGNTTLGGHVADDDVHQRIPKFVLRVAKAGARYTTVAAAIAAIPATGPDAPGPGRWWCIEIAPGVYEESVTLSRAYVELAGAGRDVTRIASLTLTVGNVILRGLSFGNNSYSGGTNRVLHVAGPGAGLVQVIDCSVSVYGNDPVRIESDAEVEFYQCLLIAQAGSVVSTAGIVTFVHTEFRSGVSSPCVHGEDTVDLRQCAFRGGQVLSLVNATARVVGCVSTGGMSDTLVPLGSGTASTIYWDGRGAAGAFGTTGTLSVQTVNPLQDEMLSANIARLDAPQAWGAPQTFEGAGGYEWVVDGRYLIGRSGGVDLVVLDNALPALSLPSGGVIAGGFMGGGGDLTGLNASALSTGTVPLARMHAQVARRDQANTFTQAQTMSALRLTPVTISLTSGAPTYNIPATQTMVCVNSCETASGKLVLPNTSSVALGHIITVVNTWYLSQLPIIECVGGGVMVSQVWQTGGITMAATAPWTQKSNAMVIIILESANRWRAALVAEGGNLS